MARTTARPSATAQEERTMHRDTLLDEYARFQGGGTEAAFQLAQDSIDALAGRYVAALEDVPADRVAAIGVIAMMMDIGLEIQNLRKDVQRLDETVGEIARGAGEVVRNQ
ncbi:hypothetical protein [Nocardiopsis synnemataformans]|uniref:hypothetical protein n=1 Tax=Nocardiopsis synnemataformans TaxID=61305 RepID=UPI003EC15192